MGLDVSAARLAHTSPNLFQLRDKICDTGNRVKSLCNEQNRANGVRYKLYIRVGSTWNREAYAELR